MTAATATATAAAHRQKLYRTRKILGLTRLGIDVDLGALAEAARAAGYVRAEQEPTASDLADIAGRILADWARGNVTT
jgi:hypothetical protein